MTGLAENECCSVCGAVADVLPMIGVMQGTALLSCGECLNTIRAEHPGRDFYPLLAHGVQLLPVRRAA
jgi:hypothetical protein